MSNSNCEIIGHKHNTDTKYYYDTTKDVGGSAYNVYCLRFKTPYFVGILEELVISLKTNKNANYDTGWFRYALCTSDANLSKYCSAQNSDVTTDDYQIASGVVTFTGVNTAGAINDIRISTTELDMRPQTDYYLIMWVYKYDSEIDSEDIPGILLHIQPCDNHTATAVVIDGLVYIDNEHGFHVCRPYINTDTGRLFFKIVKEVDADTEVDEYA